MKHSSSQILSAHWNEKRRGTNIPERREIDPAALRGALGDVFILSFEPGAGHPFRLAGTRICSLFCRELRRVPFVELWAPERRAEVSRLLEQAAADSIGIVAAVAAEGEYGASMDLELTLFPLLHDGGTHHRVIGSLAPLRAPYWLGLHPLKRLALGRYRYLGDAVGSPAPVFVPRRTPALEGLRLYEGGKR